MVSVAVLIRTFSYGIFGGKRRNINHKKIYILLSQVYCVWQVVKTPTIISNNPVCVYIHTHTYSYMAACRLYMNYRCYQITLQWNIFTQIRVVRSVDWIFIVGAPVWRWLGQYVTLDKTFYSLLLKQEAVAALLLPYFVRLSFSSTRYLLEIQ